MSALPIALMAVGGVEAVIGFLLLLAPRFALPCFLGRTLAVGGASAPAVAPLLAQTGALSLAVAVFLLAIGFSGASGSVAPAALRVLTCVSVVYCGLLKPYVLLFRSHHRMPTHWQVGLSLLEGVGLVISLASVASFDPLVLADQPSFVISAVIMMCAPFRPPHAPPEQMTT
ncbi:MAG: hypothetical protein SGPRY_010028, partial [Prymnesium sp.]